MQSKDEYTRCYEIRPGTLGYQQCIKPNGHARDRHRSQDGKTWGTAPELPGCASCGATDVEDTGEHEAQTGHRFVTDPDPEPEEAAPDVQALIAEALTEPTFGPASDRDAAQYWANLARKLARAVSPVVVGEARR